MELYEQEWGGGSFLVGWPDAPSFRGQSLIFKGYPGKVSPNLSLSLIGLELEEGWEECVCSRPCLELLIMSDANHVVFLVPPLLACIDIFAGGKGMDYFSPCSSLR